MSKILYVDSDGTKGTLPEGWLGYDAYTAGGDEGRVAVGTSSGDVLLAKKSEVDLKQDILAEGVFVDGDKTKLDTIEVATATYTNKVLDDYTNKIKANAVHMRVKNQSGVVLAKGTVVAYFGYSDTEDAVKVVKADNSVGVAIGILAEELAVDAFGMAIANGIVDGLDTSAYTNGTILYTDTSGGLTNVEPTTGFAQPIAYVLKSNATIGVLQVLAAYPKQDASDVRVTPVGELTSATVQGALEELQADIVGVGTYSEFTNSFDIANL